MSTKTVEFMNSYPTFSMNKSQNDDEARTQAGPLTPELTPRTSINHPATATKGN